MNKRLIVIIIGISMILGVSCSTQEQTNNLAKIDEVNQQVSALKIENDKLNRQIDALKSENEKLNYLLEVNDRKEKNFYDLNYKIIDFVRAQIAGDIEKLNTMLDNGWNASKQGKNVQVEGNETDWFIYHEDYGVYKDFVIQSYTYDSENDTYRINIREFFEFDNGEEKTPPTYINLYFKKLDELWKIVNLDMDV